MDCKHENKKLIDYGVYNNMHTSEYKCSDCGMNLSEIDTPIIYSYPSKVSIVNDVLIHEEDLEILKRKYKEVERNKRGD